MAKHSIIEYTGDGVTIQYAINFTGGYKAEDDVFCQVNNEVDGLQDPVYRSLTFISEGLVEIGGAVPGVGEPIVFKRVTPISEAVNDFEDGVGLTGPALDAGFQQVIFGIQEAQDNLQDAADTEDAKVAAEAAQAAAEAAQTAAETAETNAETAETNADASAVAAAASAASIVGDAAAAAASAAAALVSEGNASTSEANAGASETNAAASAAAASSDAASAASDAADASTSETNAAASAAAAASYSAALPEVTDDTFRIRDNADSTKKLAFQTSGILTGTIRTITVPDADVTLPATFDFLPLSGGTITGNLLPNVTNTTDLGSASKVFAKVHTSKVLTPAFKIPAEASDRDAQGIAAAWVNFTGTGVIAINDDVNCDSLTDNGTGDYAVSLVNGMGNANYAVNISAGTFAANAEIEAIATGSFETQIKDVAASGVLRDGNIVCATVMGELAA